MLTKSRQIIIAVTVFGLLLIALLLKLRNPFLPERYSQDVPDVLAETSIQQENTPTLAKKATVRATRKLPSPHPSPASTTTRSASKKPTSHQRKLSHKRIALIIGATANTDYKPRATAVHSLGRNLTQDQVLQLLDFLNTKFSENTDLTLLQLNSIKNDILDVLIEQNILFENLGYRIINMFNDHTMDDVWRDYCVQHFSAYYERKWPANIQDPEKDTEWQEMINAYSNAVLETGTTIAGTALIGLEMISAKHKEINRQELRNSALKIATDKTSGEPARIAALQVCALTGEQRVIPVATSIAQNSNASTVLRLSAAAATNQLQKGTP